MLAATFCWSNSLALAQIADGAIERFGQFEIPSLVDGALAFFPCLDRVTGDAKPLRELPWRGVRPARKRISRSASRLPSARGLSWFLIIRVRPALPCNAATKFWLLWRLSRSRCPLVPPSGRLRGALNRPRPRSRPRRRRQRNRGRTCLPASSNPAFPRPQTDRRARPTGFTRSSTTAIG